MNWLAVNSLSPASSLADFRDSLRPLAQWSKFAGGGEGQRGAVDYGQVVFQNNTSVTGHLYVDDGYGCGPVLMNLYCTTMVPAGVHTSYVKFDDGEVVIFEPYEVVAGEVFTLTVNEASE